MTRGARPLLGALAFVLAWQPAAAAMNTHVHAILIGIDQYASPRRHRLLAAVADASDFDRVLKAQAIGDVTLLTNAKATRAAFEAAWSAVASRALPADTIVLTFAGHGILEPEKSPVRHTPDGRNKGFILYGYDEASPKEADEILRDEHLYDLFAPLAQRGVKILFVADACHSGFATRGVDARVPERPVRMESYDEEAAPPPPLPPASTFEPRPALPGVVVLSATVENQTIDEPEIEGVARGALSWSVARTLESRLGKGEGRAITPPALQDAVVDLVREATKRSRQQTPVFRYLNADEGLFATDVPAIKARVAAPSPHGLPALAGVNLAIIGTAQKPLGAIPGAIMVTDKTKATLLWDAQRQDLLGSGGDVLASGIADDRLGQSVLARQVVNALTEAMAANGNPSTVRLFRSEDASRTAVNGPLKLGERVTFSLEKPATRYVTAFDINADGTVQFLWPIHMGDQADPVETPTDRPLTFDAPVVPPFGMDTLVFLTTDVPLNDLHGILTEIHKQNLGALALYKALEASLQDIPFGIGMQTQVTCREVKEDGLCDTNIAPSH